MKKFLTMLLALVMALSLVACGQTEQPDADKDAEGTSTDPFYIWTWNTDYQKILDEVLPKYLSEEQVSRIQIVNVGINLGKLHLLRKRLQFAGDSRGKRLHAGIIL